MDQRDAFALDRDRILYSTAFRRLAGVTQVVSPVEGEIFHSRLTHTLKVAQIARRLAEMFISQDAENKTDLVKQWGDIHPEVVEAAALAHDLGHPPFGHLAEEELDRLIKSAVVREEIKLDAHAPVPEGARSKLGRVEGYEGNAQSFRILTVLAVRRPSSPPGLDLTRATLNATLKYPWPFVEGQRKYGVYSSAEEREAFAFARALDTPAGDGPCIEAQIMDWADDITYSVHDVEDFYRAGRVPLDRLRLVEEERKYFIRKAVARRNEIGKPFSLDEEALLQFFGRFVDYHVVILEPYSGTRSQRQHLYEFTSELIKKFVTGTTLAAPPGDNGAGLSRPAEILLQVELLKELFWCYVINNPALAGQRYGQKRVIRELFSVLDEAVRSRQWPLFPPLYQERVEELDARFNGAIPIAERVRLVADAISSLTDQQAMRFYQRLLATSQGSVLDPIVT